jgi:hypothetical protein
MDAGRRKREPNDNSSSPARKQPSGPSRHAHFAVVETGARVALETTEVRLDTAAATPVAVEPLLRPVEVALAEWQLHRVERAIPRRAHCPGHHRLWRSRGRQQSDVLSAERRLHWTSIFENCRDFGRNPSARPGSAPHLRPGQRAWAIYQHEVATAVIKELRRQDLRVNYLAKELDTDYDWLLRKLYGRVPADLSEMYEWALLFGLVMTNGPSPDGSGFPRSPIPQSSC